MLVLLAGLLSRCPLWVESDILRPPYNVVISGGAYELAASAPPPLTPSAELHC